MDNTDEEVVEFMIFPKGESMYVFHRPAGQGVDYTDITVHMNTDEGTIKIASPEEYNFKITMVCFKEPKSVFGADHVEYNPDNSILTMMKKGSTFSIIIDKVAGY